MFASCIEGGREVDITQQSAVCMCRTSTFVSKASAEVYEQLCACRLFFSEASANLFFSKHLWLKRFSCRMSRQEELISKVSKMMRAHCPPGGPASSTFLQADPEHIIEKLESLVKDLVMLKEVRKTAKFLGQCAQMAFPRMPSAEHKVLGERLLAACEHIAVKRKSATTGKKTAPAVYRIIMALNVASLSLPVASTSSKSIASASKPSASTSKPSASIATAASVESFYDSMLEAAEEEQPECTDEIVSVSSFDHDHTVQYLSTKDMAMVRICGGKKIVANMKPGDSGFCIATFDSGTEYETELPNSTFLKFEDVQKKPSMNSSKKRPAAVVSTAEVSTKKKSLQKLLQKLLQVLLLCTCRLLPRNMLSCCTNHHLPGQLENDVVRKNRYFQFL